MFKRVLCIAAIATAAGLFGACSPGATPQEHIGFFFQQHANDAVKIASCESGLNPAAVSSGGGNHGLFQINSVHRAAFERRTGASWSKVYDPYWNTMYARMLFDAQGWGPWSCKRVL
ncbi:MAG TPA: transglycosylase SLT domain-containing protein [Acidimicrobiales bacterium]|nr:transglycosylase SLT domain-containing protein [Acidimicrobiales bacterium]